MDNYLLQHLLLSSSKKYPERTAVSFGGHSLTYAELNGESDRMAKILSENRVGAGDRVGLLFDKSIEALISLLGILKSGAAYVPIDPSSPRKRTEYIIKNCQMKFVVTSTTYANQTYLNAGEDGCIRMSFVWDGDGKIHKRCGVGFENIHLQENTNELNSHFNNNTIDLSPAYILHTSGSTGIPKGVVISHRNALAFINAAAEFFDINHNDNLCNQAPFHFDLSIFDIFVAIKSGATITLIPGHLAMFPVQFASLIDKEGITVLNSVASVIASLAGRGQLEKFNFKSLRYVLFSGDVMPTKYLKIAMQYMKNAKFFNVYGQTEANSSTCYFVDKIPQESNWVIPIGKSLPNFEAFALDESGKTISFPREVGELYVKSRSVAMGYLGDEKATAEAFVNDPRGVFSNIPVYRTGDLVEIDEDGNFVFLGRRDSQVKTRGYRVHLSEIECVLNNNFEVNNAVVVGVPDEHMGNRIFAVLATEDGNSSDCENQIFKYCGELLPNHMVPEKIIFCEKMPKTSSGKIDRKYLQASLF
jgi:amino acid adenylation domain-containing protein